MTIDPSHGGSYFLPPLPPREPERAAVSESFAHTVGNVVNDYNSRLDSLHRQWSNVLSQEAPTMDQFMLLQHSMHQASFYEHAARQVETALGDLVSNLVVRG